MTNIEQNQHICPRFGALSIVIGILVASWVFILSGAGTGMDVLKMSILNFPSASPKMSMEAKTWPIFYALSIGMMWWVMMIAMMLPGVLEKVSRLSSPNAMKVMAGYAVPWLFFSGGVTLFQFAAEQAGWMQSQMMVSIHPFFSAVLFFFAGLYQLSPAKQSRLAHCRQERVEQGSIYAGRALGWDCVLNSTPLMLLLFVGGVMNLYWIVGLTLLNLMERLLPLPGLISRAVGSFCLIAGILLLLI
ncbi:MAG: DUF2182 domain-containing protein [Sneathiella sp.]